MIQQYRVNVGRTNIHDMVKGQFVYGKDNVGIIGFIYDVHHLECDAEIMLFKSAHDSDLPSHVEVIKHFIPQDEVVAELIEVIKSAPDDLKSQWRDIFQTLLS